MGVPPLRQKYAGLLQKKTTVIYVEFIRIKSHKKTDYLQPNHTQYAPTLGLLRSTEHK